MKWGQTPLLSRMLNPPPTGLQLENTKTKGLDPLNIRHTLTLLAD